MELLNRAIHALLDAGLHETAYAICGHVATAAVVLFSFWYAHKTRTMLIKTLIITALQWVLMGYIMQLVLWVCSGFTDTETANLAVCFVYMPLLAWLVGKVLRLSWAQVSDQMALVLMLYHGFGRLGCIFTGCCFGYPFAAGIYSDHMGTNVFPVQIVESAIAFSIFIYLLVRAKKRAYVADGAAMPLTLAIYGLGRFFTEFLHKNEKILWGCSDLAFHALFMCFVGVVMLIILRARQAKCEQQCVGDPNQEGV